MPTEWKEEIQSAVDQAKHHGEESSKPAQDQQNAEIATPLNSIRNRFEAYVKAQGRYEEGKARRERTTIAGLFITAFFTLCLAAAGIAQVSTFIASERAFVVPVGTNFTNGLILKENPLEMWINLTNKGKSIASIDVLEVAITHKLAPAPQYFEAQQVAYPPIGSKETLQRSLEFVTGWSQQTIDQLAHGAMNFFIFGRVKYRDDFSWFGPRINGFCFRYVPSGSVSGPHAFETCREPAYTYSR